MDVRSFRHSPTGRLVAGDDFWAFVPNPLPPQLAQDIELSQHIAAASQVLTDLARLSQALPEPQTLVRPFIRREAVFSCRLAGTRVDLMDLCACQVDRPAWPDTSARTSEDDLRQVLNYVGTLEHGLRRVPSAPVNLRFMRELHAQLYQRQTPSEFRMAQNWIGPPGGLTEAIYVPPPVAEMQPALHDLESYLASTTEPKHHPLVRLAFIHYQLEAIHPFMDGNGRVGRLLILILLRQWGLLPHPSLTMSVHFERHQQAYDDHLLAVSRDGDEVTQLADTDAKQVSALAVGPDGRIVFGTSNKGSVGSLSEALSQEGTFTSQALDAAQPSRWGTLQVRSTLPEGTALTVQTRSGNVKEPDEKTWAAWSAPIDADGGFGPITSPTGRFLQYRLDFKADAGLSPTAEQVEIVYQVGNLAPVISAVSVTPSASERDASGKKETGPKAFRHILIRAEDPNSDKLAYEIAFRQAGQAAWVHIAEDLSEPKYVWDTRTVSDGVYELKVTASDAPNNPPTSALSASRISEPVVVDNTAPVIVELAARLDEKGISVSGRAADATSRIVTIHHAVDSQEDWVAVLPTDGIADSAEERFQFRLDDLKPGPHRIAIRVEDVLGNTGYATAAVTVGD